MNFNSMLGAAKSVSNKKVVDTNAIESYLRAVIRAMLNGECSEQTDEYGNPFYSVSIDFITDPKATFVYGRCNATAPEDNPSVILQHIQFIVDLTRKAINDNLDLSKVEVKTWDAVNYRTIHTVTADAFVKEDDIVTLKKFTEDDFVKLLSNKGSYSNMGDAYVASSNIQYEFKKRCSHIFDESVKSGETLIGVIKANMSMLDDVFSELTQEECIQDFLPDDTYSTYGYLLVGESSYERIRNK